MNNFSFKIFLFLVFTFIFFNIKSQTLVINEVSQGPSGSKEYVELVVVGAPTCNGISTMDLRGYYIDDNNGTFASGTGTGIADGCVRFANIAFWSAIPYGTIIVIYNDADVNNSVPGNDLSIADGNCLLVIPVSNTTLLERQTTQPSTGTSAVYPTSGFVAGGNWVQISMANSDDSFQTRNALGVLVHAVSWGNNTTSNIIYFAGGTGGKVMFNANTTNTNPATQSNWSNVVVAGNETPGVPNNAANAAWINSMNNSCTALSPMMLTTSIINAGCVCNGSATVSATGAISPYTYSWSPSGGSSASATNLCAGNYTVSVTSFNGCVQTKTVAITSSSTTSVTVNSQTVCAGTAAILTATPSTAGGTFSWSPGGLTTSSVSVSPGSTTTYSVIYTLAGCSGTNNGIVTVQPLPSVTVNSATICSGQTTTLTANGATTYSWNVGSTGSSLTVSPISNTNFTVTGTTNGCTNTTVSTVSVIPLPTVTVNSPTICAGGTATLIANGGTTYVWNTGSTSNSLVVLPTSNTNFTVIGTTNGCTNTAVSNVSVTPLPSVTVNSPTICSGQTATLIANGASTYTWNNGSNNNTLSDNPTTTTNYTVIGEDLGCLNTATTSIVINPNLSLSVNAPTICLGQTTTLTCFGATSYTWSNGSVGNNITVSPLTTTSFSVLGINGTCSGSTITTVVVNPLPTLTVNSPTICSGQTATLTANGASTYTWSTGFVGNRLVISPSSNTLILVTGTNGVCSNTTSATVNVISSPVLSVNASTICVGEWATLTVSGANSYVWNNGTTTNSIIVNPLTTTTYSVIGTIGLCSDSTTVNVSVNQLPIISATSQTICSGQTTTLTAIGASSYNWNNSTFTNTLVVSPSVTTVYNVTGFSANCSSSITASVVVNTAPNVSIISDKISGCVPLCVQFTDLTTVSSGTLTSWAWDFENGVTSNLQNPLNCFDNEGSYDISLIATSSNGCSKTYLIPNMINVFPSPVAEFTSNFQETDILNPIIDFTNLSSNSNSYFWNFGNENTSTLTNPSHTYNTEGIYSTTLTATNQFGCKDIMIHDVIVKGIFTFYAPNTFTPNEDRVNDVFIPLGVGWDLEKYELNIFDRWGNNCFNTKDAGKGWDGKVNNGNEPAQIDTYTWKVNLTDVFGKNHKYIGRISIIK